MSRILVPAATFLFGVTAGIVSAAFAEHKKPGFIHEQADRLFSKENNTEAPEAAPEKVEPETEIVE